jgi:hypothetical protein
MPQLCSGIVDPGNNLMRLFSKMHGFAPAIVRGVSARYPAPFFQSMQQGHESWLFNPQTGSNFRLGERTGCYG